MGRGKKIFILVMISVSALWCAGFNLYAQKEDYEYTDLDLLLLEEDIQEPLQAEEDTGIEELLEEDAYTDERLREKESLLKEEEKTIAALKETIASLNKQNNNLKKELSAKSRDLGDIQEKYEDLSQASDSLNKERLFLKKQLKEKVDALNQQILALEATLRNEKARLYQELGTAYTEAKLFDLGIDAYAKSLSFNPENAEVHYNIGILYKHSRGDSEKAAEHLKKYLQLSPKAKNRREVEYLIEMLEVVPVEKKIK